MHFEHKPALSCTVWLKTSSENLLKQENRFFRSVSHRSGRETASYPAMSSPQGISEAEVGPVVFEGKQMRYPSGMTKEAHSARMVFIAFHSEGIHSLVKCMNPSYEVSFVLPAGDLTVHSFYMMLLLTRG